MEEICSTTPEKVIHDSFLTEFISLINTCLNSTSSLILPIL